jgi:hypothetical protein
MSVENAVQESVLDEIDGNTSEEREASVEREIEV